MTKKKRNPNAGINLKYIGYCLAMMPPEEAEPSYEDFVEYAKFQLCDNYKVLRKDPVWDTYTDEEILIEYYALMYKNNEEVRKDFEIILSGKDPDVYDWFDDQIKKNQEELGSKVGEDISFSPDDLLGG